MRVSCAAIVFACLFVIAVADYGPTNNKAIRVRRSFMPNAPNQPQQPNHDSNSRGGVNVDIHRERGVGTIVSGKADTNIYRSQDGNTRVDAHGHWSRVYDGPARGQRNHGGGIRFSHRW